MYHLLSFTTLTILHIKARTLIECIPVNNVVVKAKLLDFMFYFIIIFYPQNAHLNYVVNCVFLMSKQIAHMKAIPNHGGRLDDSVMLKY